MFMCCLLASLKGVHEITKVCYWTFSKFLIYESVMEYEQGVEHVHMKMDQELYPPPP